MGPLVGSGDSPDIVFGLHPILEILQAENRTVQRLLIARVDGQFSRIVALARAADIPFTVEPRERLDHLVPHGRHQGVVGVVAVKAYAEEEEVITFATRQEQAPFFLLLDGVEDPQNLGAILRTAEVAGVHGVFIPERRAVGLSAGVAKSSAGALDYVQVVRTTNIGKLVDRLALMDIPSYAITQDAAKPYTDLELCGPVALVLGGEGKGIRPGVVKKCQDQAHIPMHGKITSLNVSAAAAIGLFEVVRQRGRVKNSTIT